MANNCIKYTPTPHNYWPVIEAAKRLKAIWGDDVEQIDAHLESDSFEQFEIGVALDVLRWEHEGVTSRSEIERCIAVHQADGLYV